MYHCTVSIDVPDLASAVRFYIEALGLRLKKEPTKGMAVLQTINLDVYLLEKAGGTQTCSDSSTQRAYSRHWTPVHLDFIVSKLSSALERAVAAGAKHEGGDKGDWGEIAYCSDPFGNGFCLIEK
ncbi:MAG: VOC family protein [Alphaproteobacteria bacterium]|nr:VOC family protein [Alphaproteobacteria bacterium]